METTQSLHDSGIAENWQSFIEAFCKVEFLCFQKEPNWLGWAIIGMGAFVVVKLAIEVWEFFQDLK